MNLYLVANDQDALVIVAIDANEARQLAREQHDLDNDCTATYIGKAASSLVIGDVVLSRYGF